MKRGEKCGFSLIEVLVATAVLIIIVLMIGNVFFHASTAWDTGYAKADEGMIVRTVLGKIQRELSMAVDGRLFTFKNNEGAVKVKNKSIEFFCFKPIEGDPPGREPHKIEYKWDGKQLTRKETLYKNDGNGWTSDSSGSPSVLFSKDEIESNYDIDFTFAASDGDETEGTDLEEDIVWWPAYVTVSASLDSAGVSRGVAIEAVSFGQDGKRDDPAKPAVDDIISR